MHYKGTFGTQKFPLFSVFKACRLSLIVFELCLTYFIPYAQNSLYYITSATKKHFFPNIFNAFIF